MIWSFLLIPYAGLFVVALNLLWGGLRGCGEAVLGVGRLGFLFFVDF